MLGNNIVNTSNDSATESASSSSDSCYSDNEQEQESESEPNKQWPPTLMPFHVKNYFDLTMGGKDLHVFLVMAVGCNTRQLPDHKDPLFLKAKAYHSEIKPD